MFCGSCGSVLHGTEQYCGFCGKRLYAVPISYERSSGIMGWFRTRTDRQKLILLAAAVGTMMLLLLVIILAIIGGTGRASQPSLEEQFWGLIMEELMKELT